jgi:hypothetical protein
MSRFAIVLLLAMPLTAGAEGRAVRRVVRRPPPVAAVYTPVLVQLLRKFAQASREKR